jgi:hypothetical protein
MAAQGQDEGPDWKARINAHAMMVLWIALILAVGALFLRGSQ